LKAPIQKCTVRVTLNKIEQANRKDKP